MTVFTIIEWEITMLFCCIEPIMPVRYQEFIVYYHWFLVCYQRFTGV